MFNFIFKICLIFLFLVNPSLSKNFNDVLIKGNLRISNETIIVFSEIPQEKFLDEKSLNLILKRLYSTGFFKDVMLEIEDSNLIISVVENPIIQNVFIQNIKRNKTKDSIYEILSLKDRSSFNLTSFKKDEISITNYLKNLGYYRPKITASFEELGENKINLFYKIDTGQKAKISKISFIGDKKFNNNKLRSIIVSEEYKFWKFISGKKFLNEDLIKFDVKLLTNFYKNKGFFDIIVNSSFANYLGNDEFELIYNISSGKKYFFNNLSLNLPSDYDEANFNQLKLIFSDLKGKNYSLNAIQKILKEIDKIVLYEEYEFLKSTVNEQTNDNLIDLRFTITESETKFYVEKINIFGNDVTHESVLRDRLFVDEGDAFNELLHTKSINKLKSSGFFGDVTSEVLDGSMENQKILNIIVKEKPTGELTAGAGLGTDGGKLSFGLKENNFLGKGIAFGTSLSLGSESVRGLISVDNPNYNGSNRSLNFSVESTITDRLKNFGYKSSKTGFSIGSGFEYYDDFFLNTGISSYVEKLDTDSTASTNMKKQDGSYFDTFFNYTLSYDKRNQSYQTTDGFISRFTQKVPLLSDNYSLTNTYDYKIFTEWLSQNVASFGFYARSTNSITGKNVKLSDRLFLPSSRLRGFESGKVGPKDGLDYIGGNYAIAVNLASTLPQIMPNSQNTDFSIFLDAANIWGVDYSSGLQDSSKIRSSLGIAVDFFTPIGPLSISLSEAITKSNSDITESFRFNLGTTF